MLLLKYPSPDAPSLPRTFVDDATYLRDNFSATGGANIISKYSGKPPSISPSTRPITPLGQALSPKRHTRSPLPSPARFLQQQGGVEALFQGAAKGVFDRGERLGINQAVRDAVGEVKKNMQGLQASRSNSTRRTPTEASRWSLDEGKSIPTSRASIAAVNARNQHLATMLGQAMEDLRAASIAPDTNKDTCVKAMDLAIAKVEFVKIYLEDSTMPLSDEPSHFTSSSSIIASTPQPSPQKIGPAAISTALPSSTTERANQNTTENKTKSSFRTTPISGPSLKPDIPQMTTPESSPIQTKSEAESEPIPAALAVRPKAPVPTRSSIAQSSFSWMLEPDVSAQSPYSKSSPPKSGTPFLKSGRKPTSGPNREKAAFLFGDDAGESSLSESRFPLGGSEEGFDLGALKGHKTN